MADPVPAARQAGKAKASGRQRIKQKSMEGIAWDWETRMPGKDWGLDNKEGMQKASSMKLLARDMPRQRKTPSNHGSAISN